MEATEDKQEKANRIISEAIAKARQRGEKNIPRVMSPESFPSSSSALRKAQREMERERKASSKARVKSSKSSKKVCVVPAAKIKQKAKIGYVEPPLVPLSCE